MFMPGHRGRKSANDDLLPDAIEWCRETWADRSIIENMSGVAWMLREAARVLEYSENTVNELFRI